MRYEVCNWLVGERSTKLMTPYQIKALMKVMEVTEFDTPPSDVSISELRSAHTEALKASGQAELI
jgi:hypothetical protein